MTPAEKRETPCCGYKFETPPDAGPIYWNPYNNVVQCHNCGQAFYMLGAPGPDVLDGARAVVRQYHNPTTVIGDDWLALLIAAFASAHAAAEREAGREEVLSMLSDDLEDDMRKEFGWSKTP